MRLLDSSVHAKWRFGGGLELWEEFVGHIGVIGTEFVGWQLADFINSARKIDGWTDGQMCRPYPILWKPTND